MVDRPQQPKFVGARIARFEDDRLLSGRARFIDDITPPGTRHLIFVRAQLAHARIASIDTTAATDSFAGIEVFTGDDIGDLALSANADMPEVQRSAQPLLARGRVRFVGEPVAAVLADDAYVAEDAAELVFPDYEPLPVIADVDGARAPDAAPMFDGWNGNLFVERQMKGGDIAAAKAAAAHVVQRTYRTQRQAGVPMEGRGVVAQIDPASGDLTVWSSTQIPHLLRTLIAEELDWPETRLRVIAPEVGGGFGVKGQAFVEELLVAWLAIRTGRPVKWIEDRREHLIASIHARDHVHTVEAYLDADAMLLGLKADITVDVGAYSTWPFTAGGDPGMVAKVMPGPYHLPAYEATFRAVATNKCPLGTYRGVGRPSAVFSQERLMDDIAVELGIDPVDLRLRNIIRDFPYKNVLGFTYDEGSYAACLEQANDLLAPDRAEAARTRDAADIRVGVGLACFVEQTAHGTPDFTRRRVPIETGYEGARVEMAPDGGVLVSVGLQCHGQGHETTLAQIAADRLGVLPEDVKVVHGDTATTPYSVGTWGSRGVVLGGGAVDHASQPIAEKLRRIAGHIMQEAPERIVLAGGLAAVDGDPGRSVPIRELARSAQRNVEKIPDGMEPGLSGTAYVDGPPDGTYSNAVHAAVVEIDMATGRLRVRRFVVVEDCGTIVNPTIVDGQVRGGIVQGLGSALFEHFVYDRECQPLTTNFGDYLMPAAGEIPEIEVHHIETPSPLTPLGMKGLGEGGAIGPAAAVANAVADALGVAVEATPLTANRVWELVQQATGAANQ